VDEQDRALEQAVERRRIEELEQCRREQLRDLEATESANLQALACTHMQRLGGRSVSGRCTGPRSTPPAAIVASDSGEPSLVQLAAGTFLTIG
jgi:hypothetical protein